MSDQPSSSHSVTTSEAMKLNSFNMSMLIGLVLVMTTVMIIAGIIMNVWIKNNRKSKVLPMVHEKKLHVAPTKADKPILFQYIKPPKQAYKVDVLPDYRKSDTWESYLKMIQTPDKLNDVIRTMKVNHSPSNSISSNVPENGNTNANDIENKKVSYDNNNNSFNHTLQRESLHLQQKEYSYDFI